MRRIPRAASKSRGVTLLELLIVLGLLAVLSALAVPTFSQQQAHWRQRAVAAQLMSAIWIARGSALKTRGSSILCPSRSEDCVGVYSQGFSVFDGEGRLVRAFPPRRGVSVHNRGGEPQAHTVTWDSNGLANRNMTFLLCSKGYARNWSVVLNRIGRPRLVKDWGTCPG